MRAALAIGPALRELLAQLLAGDGRRRLWRPWMRIGRRLARHTYRASAHKGASGLGTHARTLWRVWSVASGPKVKAPPEVFQAARRIATPCTRAGFHNPSFPSAHMRLKSLNDFSSARIHHPRPPTSRRA